MREKNMPWLQLILDTDAQQVNQLSEALTAIGALSVTWQDAEDQPLYEPPLDTTPLWEHTRVVGLFEGDADGVQLQAQLQAMLAPLPLPNCQVQLLADQDWSRVWMNHFHPMQFGSQLWVCPSWEKPPDSQAVNVVLDPGLAFGSGTHTTTALCLEWLEQHREVLQGQTLIDYGCGSGILAIAAVKLGASQVWAVDNDPQALQATQNNSQQNLVATKVITVLPEQLPSVQADGLLANILAKPLRELVATFADHLKNGAWVVLSGILQEQTAEVIAAYQPYFTIIEVVERENWIRVVGKANLASRNY
jgi:ribosomal protein L11 methyltransferase